MTADGIVETYCSDRFDTAWIVDKINAALAKERETARKQAAVEACRVTCEKCWQSIPLTDQCRHSAFYCRAIEIRNHFDLTNEDF